MTILTTLLLGTAALQTASSLDNALDAALGSAGLDKAGARIEASAVDIFRTSSFSPPLVDSGRQSFWRWPALSAAYRLPLTTSAHQPEATLAAAGRLAGLNVRRDLVKDAIETAEGRSLRPEALSIALERMRQRGAFGAKVPPTTGLPSEVQRAAALVLEVALDAVALRQAAFSGVTDIDLEMKRARPDGLASDPVEYRRALETASKIDISYLLAASEDLARAVEHASQIVDSVPTTASFDWRVSTAWGDIVLTGGKNDVHTDRPVLLLIDTGGDDSYVNLPANKNAANWLSVVIDSRGNDKYVSEPDGADKPIKTRADRAAGRYASGPASASFGVSLLFDNHGDDLYRSTRPAFGSANCGVAYLVDGDGGDIYDAYAGAEGFASFGIGILEDLEGKDTYRVFNQGQGCGLTSGVGLLIDRRGNDTYVAEDEPRDFPAAPDQTHNASYAQGAGVGLRMDVVNGKSLGGGTGVLLDVEGTDQYFCGVYGQGVGYWEGCGFLWDLAGDDIYSAQRYAQGSSTQFGFGSLEDLGGDDVYTLNGGQGMGFGQDFGLGLLLDAKGADKHTVGPEALGFGSLNGVGWFADLDGDDLYEAKGRALGEVNESPSASLREPFLTLGVFLDLAGRDTYPPSSPWAKNSQKSTQLRRKGGSPAEAQAGLFYDR